MRKAKEELGEDARLVSAKRVSPPDLPPVYEVRVVPATLATVSPTGLDALRRDVEAIRETLSDLRRETGEEDSGGPAEAGEPDPQGWLDVLRRRGVGPSSARRIAGMANRRAVEGPTGGTLAALRAVIAEELEGAGAAGPPGERSTIFVGPTGAGKTTVLAKVAARLVARGERPFLVSTDGESIAGEENLEAIAEALGLRFETAYLSGRVEALRERAGPGEILLVDTPGRSPFERDGLSVLRALADALPDAEVLPVIPASTDAEEARLILRGYRPLGADRVVLTKLDELSRPGRIVDLVQALEQPVAWITYGREVRGASSSPDDPRVVSRILGTALALDESA